MDFLRKFTIQQRLAMLVALIIIGLTTLDGLNLFEEYKSLVLQKNQPQASWLTQLMELLSTIMICNKKVN